MLNNPLNLAAQGGYDETLVRVNSDILPEITEWVNKDQKIGFLKVPTWDFLLPASLQFEQMPAERASQDQAFEIMYFFFVLSALNFRLWERTNAGIKLWSYSGFDGVYGLAAFLRELYDGGHFPGLHIHPKTTKFYGSVVAAMPLAVFRFAALECVSYSDNFKKNFAQKLLQESATADLKFAQTVAASYEPAFGHDPFLARVQLFLTMATQNLALKNVYLQTELHASVGNELPHVLRQLRVLSCSDNVACHIASGAIINKKVENALRAASFLACEELTDLLGRPSNNIAALLVNYGQSEVFKTATASTPMHYADTTNY